MYEKVGIMEKKKESVSPRSNREDNKGEEVKSINENNREDNRK